MSEAPIHIGTAGWSYKDWDGVVYPSGKDKPRDALEYLARFFSCVEVNSTFYRIPTPDTVASWAERTAGDRDFLFTVKLWRGFTHGAEEEFTSEACRSFGAAMEPLREAGRLGAVLVQFPWFFRNTGENRGRLERIAEAFDRLPLVLEVRSRSWADPKALEMVAAMGYSFCNIDQPLARDSLKPAAIVTGPVGYARLHGRNAKAWFDPKAGRDEKYDYLYDQKELSQWVDLIGEIRRKAQKTFVVTNNHFKGQAAANALELQAELFHRRVDVPEPLCKVYPRLNSISRVRHTLFDE
jgi:uncharacterized protein YecE (DUF72 family)